MSRRPRITDLPGVSIGHATDPDGVTGATAILFAQPAVAGADVRGGGAGTRTFAPLLGHHVVGRIDGVLFAGGSEYGLDAAGGVMRRLEERGQGFRTPAGVVPIVPTAILYDLGIGDPRRRPDVAMGYAAASAACSEPPAHGSVGVGTGATIGKLAGMDRATKSGFGTACLAGPGGLLVGCAVAVNAVGDLLDPATGRRVAGTRVAPGSRALADGDALLLAMPRAPDFGGLANTTLACVITNAALSREVLVHVAAHVHDGLARVLSPVHTRFDGDLAIACSCGDVAAAPDAVAVLARRAAMHAVMEAVRSATGVGGVPSAGELGLVIPDPGAW